MAFIKYILIRSVIPLSNDKRQCYDGAKNMCGSRTGVLSQILRENSKAFFVNCFGQAMNLAVSDICFLKDVLETIYEISNLIKIYPKRNQMLNRIRLFPIQDFAFFARQGRP